MASKDFEALVTRAMAVPGRTHMRPVVEKLCIFGNGASPLPRHLGLAMAGPAGS
ncbi:hypothetical protein [Alloalcanivorax xenomutans]|uniref:hypothetical protein n=1 Tax=Alloalcanivorax xenomutans TaxID=1094342 RepID=UPI000A68DB52|nr:hypothetical protein [Alloalcanivorax xenomutans]MBA4721673.1 hypothetical protein [Alcanivorax sp.]MCE7523491.1 hypothetical protein [Alloalcanivorax xenomutans]